MENKLFRKRFIFTFLATIFSLFLVCSYSTDCTIVLLLVRKKSIPKLEIIIDGFVSGMRFDSMLMI